MQQRVPSALTNLSNFRFLLGNGMFIWETRSHSVNYQKLIREHKYSEAFIFFMVKNYAY